MRFLVVDDDPLVCETVESFLGRIEGVDYCLKAGDGVSALTLLSGGGIDAAFLDLQLPGLDGVSLIASLPRDLPLVIISASEAFGARSYAFNVVDYLVKPLEFARFHQAVQRLKDRRLPPRPTDGEEASISASQRSLAAGRELFVKDGSRIVRIELEKLQILRAESNYVEFISTDSSVLSLISMKRLEELLPDDFIRIHRSYFVNRAHLAKIEEGYVHVGKHRLPISQGYKDELLKRLRIIN
jgi:two-component system LytT family response regulator